jgi:hypothetical protein
VKSIREGYTSPRAAAAQKTEAKTSLLSAAKVVSQDKKDPILNEVNAYLRSLSKDELATLETEALKRAPSVVADGYYRSKTAGGLAHETYRSMLLEREARRIIEARCLKKAS